VAPAAGFLIPEDHDDEEDTMTSKLSDEQKAYVVKRLAAYDKPLAIAQGLNEVFGVTISTQAIEHYDPERPAGHDLARKWRDVFWKARTAFIASIVDTGTMLIPVRLRLRERMAMLAFEEGNYKLANDILDSIAKEAGHVFANGHGNGLSGGVRLAATVTCSDPAEPEPASQADDGVKKRRD
jgi:hypothetical protein